MDIHYYYLGPCQRHPFAMKADRTSIVRVTGVTLSRAGVTNIAVSRSAAARRAVGPGVLPAADRSPRGLSDARCHRVGALCGESQKPAAAAGPLSCGQPRLDGTP